MKKILFLSFVIISNFLCSQKIIPNYPKGQNPYKNGNIELFKDMNNWLVQNNEKPCERNELYWVTLKIDETGKLSLIRNKSDQLNAEKNKCAYEMLVRVLGGLKNWQPAEVKGKKVTLKLGEQYSGLKIAGGLSVVGRVTTASSNNIGLVNGIPAGTENYNSGFSTAVKGGLLDALKGDNVFQFSFVPGDINGVPVPYNGVRIQLGSLLGVADLANVFYAYIEEEVATDVSQDIIRVDPPQSLNYPTSQNDINGTYITGIDNEDFLLNKFYYA